MTSTEAIQFLEEKKKGSKMNFAKIYFLYF